MPRRLLLVAVATVSLGVPGAVAAEELLKGICYEPVPVKEIVTFPDVDFMMAGAQQFWAPRPAGRGDFATMRKLGANMVRTFDSDPFQNHRAFLDAADAEGLSVMAGISDAPYTQMPGNCASTNWDCSRQVAEQYLTLLQNGFKVDRAYHPALRYVVLMNEPELKIQGGSAQPKLVVRALISALDGILDAERATQVVSGLPKLTVAFTFSPCSACSAYANDPALGLMDELERAVLKPEVYGYTPRNDIRSAYRNRFVHSFNADREALLSAETFRISFLDLYEPRFEIPVFVGQYHNLAVDSQGDDLEKLVEISKSSKRLLGFVFFEFQVRYWKGPLDEAYGMFGLGNKALTKVEIEATLDSQSHQYTVWCLDAVPKLPAAAAGAFGGEVPSADELCPVDGEEREAKTSSVTWTTSRTAETTASTTMAPSTSNAAIPTADAPSLRAGVPPANAVVVGGISATPGPRYGANSASAAPSGQRADAAPGIGTHTDVEDRQPEDFDRETPGDIAGGDGGDGTSRGLPILSWFGEARTGLVLSLVVLFACLLCSTASACCCGRASKPRSSDLDEEEPLAMDSSRVVARRGASNVFVRDERAPLVSGSSATLNASFATSSSADASFATSSAQSFNAQGRQTIGLTPPQLFVPILP